jgi:hypothetical protein
VSSPANDNFKCTQLKSSRNLRELFTNKIKLIYIL